MGFRSVGGAFPALAKNSMVDLIDLGLDARPLRVDECTARARSLSTFRLAIVS